MANDILAIMGALAGFGFLLMLALYIYIALALMTIAKKTKTENAWLAWIPLANIYLMARIAEVPLWTLLLFLLGFLPVIGGLVVLGVSIWYWWKISEARNKPGWLSLLLLIPIVNLVVIGLIAWTD